MNDYDLSNMPKLQHYVQELRNLGVEVKIERLGPDYPPGRGTGHHLIILNNWYIRRMDTEYDEDRMIVVLFHEQGHLEYFKTFGHEPTQEEIDEEESEYRAFKYSLEKCREIAKEGNPGPLISAIIFITKRSKSGKEPAVYQAALDRLMNEPI
ncbi:MAG: hypothetical protein L0332_13040, partial [Chloroflexi bacterium]|nr:hypothetical protein [Chloroflexota bacterium]